MEKRIFILVLSLSLLMALGGMALAEGNPLLPFETFLNSNDTGFFTADVDGTYSALVRAVPGQLVHTNFQLNTNSCASCHMTHSAVGGNLLFQRTVSDTCFACHDGTIGVLSVLTAPNMDPDANRFGGSETAGTFGFDEHADDFNPSVHNVDQVSISGAPGGNRTTMADSAGLVSTGWAGTFTCASCHAPHGSYSIRLLHSNPNFLGWRDSNPNQSTNFATGGLWTRGNRVTIDPAVVDYVYTVAVTVYGSNVITAPWLYGYASATTLAAPLTLGTHTFPAGRYNRHATRIYATNLYDPNLYDPPLEDPDGGGPFSTVVDGVYILNSFFDINYGTGTITITPANRASLEAMGADLGALRMDIARALVVTAETNANEVPASSNFINTKTYSQLNYNLFCAACHTDYLPQGSTASARASALPGGYGTFNANHHRHTINRAATQYGTMTVTGVNAGTANRLLCVSCHFAHGADSRMMRLANAELNKPATLVVDVNPSSALKRYVNQAVCWSCHANSAATVFKNTDYYWDNYVDNGGYSW